MGKVKDRLLDLQQAIEVFGDFRKRFTIATDEDILTTGEYVCLVNSNCEMEFDNVRGVFENNLLYYFIVDLELQDADYSQYVPEKSNNGGAYAFMTAKVLKVHRKSY